MMTDNLKSPTLHFFILLLVAAFMALIATSILFKVEIVAQGKGRVIPKTRVQVIQPEFMGQIKAIVVRDGDVVLSGDVLIQLDQTDIKAKVNNLSQEQKQLLIEAKRIAVSSNAILNLNDKHSIDAVIAKAHFNEPDDAIFRDIFFDEQLSLLDAEILDLNSRLFQYKAKLDVNEHSKNITKINIDQTRFALKTREERLNARKTLLDDGNTSRASYLDILDIFNETKKQLEVAERELARQISDDQVIMAERQSLLASEKRRLFARGTEITSRLTVLDNELSAAIRQLKGMIIRSPVNGTVDSMKIYTIGGLAKEGEELMRIVPTNDNAEIEATFSNNDIGFLKLGQTANIKLDAFPSSRFGHIEGVVADVSADARKDEQNNWSFTVRITPREPTLKTPTSEHPLQPGMTASIDVITGNRRLISYFFAPIVEVIQGSLGER